MLVLSLLIIIPLSLGYYGNSANYDVIVTEISMISFEETIFQTINFDTTLNSSIEINLNQIPINNGTSALYEVLPGLSRLLGPLANNISFTTIDGLAFNPYSIINCSGYDIFSFHTIPNSLYSFSDETGLIKNWSNNGIYNCSNTTIINNKPYTTFYCNGKNLTCHYKVDDSIMNSSEINSVRIINFLPYITWFNFTPIIAYTNTTLNCSANATDPEGNESLTYYYYFEKQNNIMLQNWSINNLFDCNNPNCYKHDNITCYILANDGISNSTINFTNTIEILNTIPTFSNLIINDSVIKFGDPINLSVKNVYDEDNDSIRLECGNISKSNNLCIGNYGLNGTDNLFCINNSVWSDDINHTIFCRVFDGEEYSSTELNVTIISDNTKPTIKLMSPLDESEWNQSFTIVYNFNVTDTNNITYCELKVNNNIKDQSNSISKEIEQNFRYYNITIEIQYWNITCIDEAGNINTSETWIINKTTEEIFYLRNIGFVGFENISLEYTYTKLVMLNTKLIPTSEYCRYSNENGSFLNDWEECILTKEWFLSDYDGLKKVYVEINHSGLDYGRITNFSDTINLQSNGSNLDITPPGNFNITDEGEYSNKNETFSAIWDMPFDIETLLTYGKITFEYQLYDNTSKNNVTNWVYTQDLNIEITNLKLLENHTYILFVNATNPSGLTTQSKSDGIIIDLTPPNITNIFSTINNNSWTRINNVTFNFSAQDTISGVKGVTMILDKLENTNINDDLKEIENVNITYTNLEDGIYYFHIKAYDNANNFGETLTYNYSINIDTTPPTKPIIYVPTKYADTKELFFEWIASIDEMSGIDYYNITIINVNDSSDNQTKGTIDNKYKFDDASLIGKNYYVIITAYDNAGNYIESLSNYDKTPIKIISAYPNTTIIKNDPIIKVWTSKEGICFAEEKEFLYTNSKYHEIKLKKESGIQSTIIICEDKLGYKDTVTISYTINKDATGTISIGDIPTSYVSKTITIPFNISGIGQINKDDLKIYINSTELNDFSVESIDNKGMYELKFIISEKGSYILKIKFGDSESTKTFFIQSKTLSITHSNIDINDESKTNIITSNYNNKTFGIATNSHIIEKSNIGDKFNITIDNKGKAYIFFTNKNINLKVKNEELSKDTFDVSLNSFGYVKNNDYIIKNSLLYDYIILTGLEYITPGSYNLFIKNLGTENDKTKISVEIE